MYDTVKLPLSLQGKVALDYYTNIIQVLSIVQLQVGKMQGLLLADILHNTLLSGFVRM